MENTKAVLIKDEISEKIISVTQRLVCERGVKAVNVSCILRELGVTNRVFYNRFHSLDEVLKLVYEKLVVEMRRNIEYKNIESSGIDFFEYVRNIIVKTLTDTYDLKKNFIQYAFEHDAISTDNRSWWTGKIKDIFEYGMKKGLLKPDLDVDTLSYFVWCMCRGCNADAVVRNLTIEEATDCLLSGFNYFLDGIKEKRHGD